jgi:hypothetical protein
VFLSRTVHVRSADGPHCFLNQIHPDLAFSQVEQGLEADDLFFAPPPAPHVQAVATIQSKAHCGTVKARSNAAMPFPSHFRGGYFHTFSQGAVFKMGGEPKLPAR